MAKPKIRFKGYTDDWEQRKLGDMMDVTSVKRIRQSDWTDSGVRFLRARDIVAESKNEEVSEPLFISQEKYDEYSAVSGKVEKGDLLVTGVGTIGVPMLINSEEPLYFKDGNIIWFKNKNAIDGRFFYHLFNGLNVQKFIKESAGTGTVGTYTIENGKKTPINLPLRKEEQEKIGEYFSNLDHLITLHQRKCEETKKLKKYMLQKMFPQNGQTVPEIRFAGFTDAWEQRKLGDVLVSLQNNTLSRADLSNETGVAKNVHYGDVLIKFGEVLDVSKELLPMISDKSILIKYKTSFLQNGDVIIADTAEDTTVGKCSEIVGLNDEVVLSGLHTIPYRPVEKFAPKYLGYYLNSDAYHNQLIPLMQGIKVTSISKSAMQDTDIIYPKSKEEQTEIGNYFDALDHLITLHQHKYEQLQSMKKFMLQNMFV